MGKRTFFLAFASIYVIFIFPTIIPTIHSLDLTLFLPSTKRDQSIVSIVFNLNRASFIWVLIHFENNLRRIRRNLYNAILAVLIAKSAI